MRFDARTRRLALLAIGMAVLAGVIAGLLGRGRFAGRYAVPAQRDGPAATARPAPPPPVVAPSPPAPVVASPPPAPDTDTDDDRDAGRIAAAIGRATRKALDRGAAVRWHKAGQTGYVVVSVARDYPDRVCRTVSATIVADAGETRSGAHLWCRFENEDGWRPAP